MSGPKIRLITRGDDSGSARSANVAIRDCVEKGTFLVVGHPGYIADDMKQLGIGRNEDVAVSRNWQRLMFMDERIISYCAARGIEAIRATEID
ncbi:hypothetical protein GX586_12990 [bacterium]|nr:hypothetical protein [bacterium]